MDTVQLGLFPIYVKRTKLKFMHSKLMRFGVRKHNLFIN